MDYQVLLGSLNMINNNKIKYIQFEYWDGVRKFYDLLNDKYKLYFIQDENTLTFIDESIINLIDNKRIPNKEGGDVFCVHKSENLI